MHHTSDHRTARSCPNGRQRPRSRRGEMLFVFANVLLSRCAPAYEWQRPAPKRQRPGLARPPKAAITTRRAVATSFGDQLHQAINPRLSAQPATCGFKSRPAYESSVSGGDRCLGHGHRRRRPHRADRRQRSRYSIRRLRHRLWWCLRQGRPPRRAQPAGRR
jgi:hypothetical protein